MKIETVPDGKPSGFFSAPGMLMINYPGQEIAYRHLWNCGSQTGHIKKRIATCSTEQTALVYYSYFLIRSQRTKELKEVLFLVLGLVHIYGTKYNLDSSICIHTYQGE